MHERYLFFDVNTGKRIESKAIIKPSWRNHYAPTYGELVEFEGLSDVGVVVRSYYDIEAESFKVLLRIVRSAL